MGNFIFKIIPKIIQEIIKQILPRVISKEQTDFICGRDVHSNIGLASEFMNDMETKRKGGNMPLKIDIQQAYDTLEWNFLFEVLERVGLSVKII